VKRKSPQRKPHPRPMRFTVQGAVEDLHKLEQHRSLIEAEIEHCRKQLRSATGWYQLADGTMIWIY